MFLELETLNPSKKLLVKTIGSNLFVVVVVVVNLFKVGQIYNSANIFTIQYIITNQNRLTKNYKLIL